VEKAPTESYADIGGLQSQIQEVKEAVELPLTHPELYEDIGIKPPKGVIFYGPPGTGKTLLAKAVANETSATFLRVVGSELIQKYMGEGPKMVRELFRVADEHAPSIVFIDEIDAVGTKRYDSTSGGEKEIQRTMLELLNQLDGFDNRGEVKVIMATNRIESLDPALLRPGRIDRKIEFPVPDVNTRRKIFAIQTARMTLAEDVKMEELITAKENLSGADIKAICTEAGRFICVYCVCVVLCVSISVFYACVCVKCKYKLRSACAARAQAVGDHEGPGQGQGDCAVQEEEHGRRGTLPLNTRHSLTLHTHTHTHLLHMT
jgi:26S proteasome regulatory subunit T2